MSTLTVVDIAGESHVYEDFSRFCTDESNNLCVYSGDSVSDQLIGVYAAGQWRSATVHDKEL